MTTGLRAASEFCWFNMLTPAPADACAFFARVLGWTYVAIPGVGFTVEVSGHAIGGLFDLHSPRTPPGTPPLIGPMVKVAKADDDAARVAALGGRARPPFDIGGAGRVSVCHDPCGAELDVWEPRALRGTDVDDALHGAPSWFELMTPDAARATAFYTELFGWTATTAPLGTTTYTTFAREGVPVAGMLAMTPAMGALPSRWHTYFTVTSLDEALDHARELEGAVDMAPVDVDGGRRIAGLVSPQGVPFRVVQHAGG
jgi:predicted enzyme related to lactoylglutathione lyase